MNKTQLLQGTLDLLILRILDLGPNHGWGISSRLQQISQDGLKTSQGSVSHSVSTRYTTGRSPTRLSPEATGRTPQAVHT